MQRTVSDLLSQKTNTQLSPQLLQVKKRKVAVLDVLFPSHSLVVAMQGYGSMVVKADPSIPFGTFGRPLVSTQNIATIEYSDTTGTWTATSVESSNTCLPDATVNVPNIPLPASIPMIDSSIVLEPFRVDTNFNPHVGPMGQVVPSSKMPPQILPPGTSGGIDKTPLEISQTPYLPSTFDYDNFSGMALQGDILAVYNTGNSGGNLQQLTLFSVSNVFSPIQLYQGALGGGLGGTQGIKFSGKYIYSINDILATAILITDVSNPYSPSTAGTLATVYNTVYNDFALFSKAGTTYFATCEFNGGTPYIKVYDVTNPAAISVVGSLTGFAGNLTDTDYSTYCDGIFFVTGSGGTVTLFDIYTDPTTPALITTVTLPATLLGPMCATHNRLYIADINNSPYKIYVYDVSTPATPVLLYSFSPDTGATFDAIVADGRFCYVTACSTTNRLYVIDVASTTSATVVGTVDLNNSNCPFTNALVVNGNHAFLENIGGAGGDQPILEIVGF